ncbi:hypothetical protein RclHR1_02520002 [Rhizophagus clarus]|uniref:F-box domain-containing protein n=1 Tax=Rhizophagus clarus TaxID=94130 RepID=A0A2Z6QZ03_9GLOM|nr:hypothetical protein RclHR1_02520002 [Rhizophagus clarus]GES72770.1 hypothetical protein GLOIN_2v1790806 [Rhizophagus clarus]
MSCSKIFSGDLPELIYEVIKCFKNDFSTLHSCILVNRLWCRLAIPLLWEDPFSIPTKNYNFIEIYLHSLDDDNFKAKLNEYDINNYPFLSSNTLFNYPSFIKYLNTWKIISSIERWVSAAVLRNLTTEAWPSNHLTDSRSEFNFIRLTNKSLFKIFIENEVKLHTLEIETISYIYHDYFQDVLKLILQNSNFICSVKNLKLHVGDTPFYYPFRNVNENNLIKKSLSQIINSQKNLKKILFSSNSLPLYQSLLSSKDFNCSNTLNTIIFYCINFKNMTTLSKAFEQLNVLESVHIFYCYTLNLDFIQQVINLSRPFKLKTLFMDEILQIEPLQLLLQKSGSYLENCGFGFGYNLLKRQLLELIIKYCSNIKFFDLYGFENQIIYIAFNLIDSIKQNLNYLSINVCETFQLSDDIERSSIILRNLGQILPSRLEYLSLILHINASDFEIFLKNSKNIYIKKLLINNKMQQDSENILLHVKEYIMKKKRVEYLAIMDSFTNNSTVTPVKSKDLYHLKDEVKEFKLYNIKVQNYYELFVKVYEFIKEMN